MSKIAMTRAQRRKFDATVSDARRTAHDAVETVREATDRARKLSREGTDRAKELSREGTRRGRAAGAALAGREPRGPSFLLFAAVGAIGAGLGAIATVIGRRAALVRRQRYAEDLSASVAKELGVADVRPEPPAVVPVPPVMPVNGSVPSPRGRTTNRVE
jgi:hypothetical protein